MLVARGETTVGAGTLRWMVIFGANLWVSVIERRGLVLDTRFVPPSSVPRRDKPALYLLFDGELFEGADRFAAGPSALLVSDTHLDGAGGERPWSYRASGEPFRVIELHLDPDETSLQPRARPEPFPLDAASWDAARGLLDARSADDDAAMRAFTHLMRSLEAQSLVTHTLVLNTLRPTPAPFQIIWRGIGPMVSRLQLSPTIKELSSITGTTSREVDRVVRAFVSSFGLVGESWREMSRFWRIKLAVLFLTAEGATVAEIAQAVGYGSSDAMGRAFRDAGLPAPTVIQGELSRISRSA